MQSKWLAFGLTAFVATGTGAQELQNAQAATDAILVSQLSSCDAKLSELRADISRVERWTDACTIGGAIVALFGAVLTVFLSETNQRKTAAVVAAFWAVLEHRS